jgi:hypothetical protein
MGKPAAARRGNALSNAFAVAAIAFGLLAVLLFIRDSGGGVAPVPTAAPGGNQIVNVTDALAAQGLAVEQPPGLFIAKGPLQSPGQGVVIDGQPAFIFLYPDAESARADAAGADPNQVVPDRLAGTPAPAGERRLVQGSNVIVLMIGGSPRTWEKVQTAIGGLR